MMNKHKDEPIVPKNGLYFKVLAYVRVSISESRTGGHTLDTQELRLRQKFEQIYGIGKFQMEIQTDDGISGGYGIQRTSTSKKIRPGLLACSKALATGEYDAFAVYNLSRLARDPVILEQFLREYVMNSNTAFHSATEEIDLTTPQGWLTIRVMTAVNTSQREGISERNLDAARARVDSGYFMGMTGYGWQWEPLSNAQSGQRRRILPVPDQGEWVKKMMGWYLAGWGSPKIAGELNDLGVPPPEAVKGRAAMHKDKPPSNKWIAVSVMKTLTNPCHAGLVMRRDGSLLPAEFWEHRYFEPEVREKVMVTKTERKKFPTNTNKHGNAHLLNGIISCSKCNRRLYPSRSSDLKRSSYRCCGGHSHAKKTCPGIVAQETLLDEAVVAEIEGAALEPEMQMLVHAEMVRLGMGENKERATLQAQLNDRKATLVEQFNTWAGMLSNKTITVDEFEQFNGKLRADRDEVDRRLGELQAATISRDQLAAKADQMMVVVKQFPQIWKHLKFEERREVITQLIEKLALDRDVDGTTRLLTIKLHLLPERTIRLPDLRAPRPHKTAVGIAALTPRQLAFLCHLDDGKTEREAAALLCVNHSTVRVFIKQIRDLLGVHEMSEAARMARGRIHLDRGRLPLGSGRGPKTKTENGIHLSSALREVLPLFASGAKIKEVAKVAGISEAEATLRRNRILESVYASTMFEAVTSLRKSGIQF